MSPRHVPAAQQVWREAPPAVESERGGIDILKTSVIGELGKVNFKEYEKMKTIDVLTQKIENEVIKKLNHDRGVVIVRQKNNGLRVYHLTSYLTHKHLMRQIIKKHQPWKKRQKSVLGPIGSKPLGVIGSISRTDIYEGR
jgi:hypothetical protein